MKHVRVYKENAPCLFDHTLVHTHMLERLLCCYSWRTIFNGAQFTQYILIFARNERNNLWLRHWMGEECGKFCQMWRGWAQFEIDGWMENSWSNSPDSPPNLTRIELLPEWAPYREIILRFLRRSHGSTSIVRSSTRLVFPRTNSGKTWEKLWGMQELIWLAI